VSSFRQFFAKRYEPCDVSESKLGAAEEQLHSRLEECTLFILIVPEGSVLWLRRS